MSRKITRALTAATVLAVCLALCSCTFFNALTAYGLYSRSAKKLEKAGGCEADCLISMSFNIFGEDVSSFTDMRIKQNGDRVQTIVALDDGDVTSTRIGNTVYVEYAGTYIKYSIPEQDGAEDGENAFTSIEIPAFSKDIFEGIGINQDDDGTKSVLIDLDSETAMEYLGSFLGEDETVTPENVSLEMVFDKENDLQSMKITCTATADVLGLSVSGEVSANYTFINFGEVPEITLGRDESEYEDGGEYQG